MEPGLTGPGHQHQIARPRSRRFVGSTAIRHAALDHAVEGGNANSLRPRCRHSHGPGPAPRSRPLPAAIPASPPGSRNRALHDRSADQRSIRWRIDQAPVPVGQLPAPAITFYGFRPAPRQTCVTRPVVAAPSPITSSVAIVNDTTWSTIVGTWRPGRLELYVDGWSRASSTAAATNTSALFGIYRWGWGFSTSQDFNGDIALIACFASSWTPAMVRRWHANPSASCAHGTSCLRSLGARHPPRPPRPVGA